MNATQTAAQRVDGWLARWGERLTSECPEVQAEIRGEALDRYVADGRIGWRGPHVNARGRPHPGDTEICRMRVVSRIRVKTYGEIPDGQEWMRQVNEIRRRLGMPAMGEERHQQPPVDEPRKDSGALQPHCPPGGMSLREWREREARAA